MNLLDIAALNGRDMVAGLIEEVMTAAPEVMALPARTIKGVSYKTTRRTSLPSVGFHAAGASLTASKSAFADYLTTCAYLGGLVQLPKSIAQASEDGTDMLKAIEAEGVMEQALKDVGKQLFYGPSNTTYGSDADGFPGLLDGYDSTNMVVDAGGTTATTGSSVWIVGTGVKSNQLVVGMEGEMELSEWRVETVSGVPSHVADLTAYVGLQMANPNNTIVRVKKLTEDSGKGLTDALLAKALALFPIGVQPTHIFMSRRSRRQLQTARTVTLFGNGTRGSVGTATGLVAPTPTEFEGVPIIATDSLSNVEALTL